MGYLTGYKVHLCVVAVLLVISSVCSVGGSFLIKPLINDYILPGDFPGLARMLCVMAAVYVAGAACSYGYARIMVHVSQNTVAKIREAFRTRLKDTTKIIIAQRVTSVMDADLIVVMDRGRIAAQGRHEELMKTCDIYREVYTAQQEGVSIGG